MKKLILFSIAMLCATAVYAAGKPLLNDNDAFILAKSVKLSTVADEGFSPAKDLHDVENKEKYECSSDSDCPGVFVCKSNKCVDPCEGISCAAGKTCSVGTCINCAYGSTGCRCPSGQYANGTGGCFAPCSPNKCTATTPTCTPNGTNYKCTCTETSCGLGKLCTNGSCVNCEQGTQCNCPTDQVADGAGGCGTSCAYTPEVCATENGGTAADWTVDTSGKECKCVTDKKYVLMQDMHPEGCYSANTLKRVKAVKDFGNIKAGTLGGYIESEANLSQTGNSWVGCDSRGCARVEGNSKVYGNALVEGAGRTSDFDGNVLDGYCGATRISGDSEIYGNAKVLAGSYVYNGKVYDRAVLHGLAKYPGAPTHPKVGSKGSYWTSSITIGGEVYGDAQVYLGGYLGGSGSPGPNNVPRVYGKAILAGGPDCRARVTYLGRVYENAKVFRCGEVSGNARVYGNAVIENTLFGPSGNAHVYGNARLGGHSIVNGNAKLYGSAVFASPDLTYLCGTATMSGSASITGKKGSKYVICKGNYTSGSPGWQESTCSSKNCPQ